MCACVCVQGGPHLVAFVWMGERSAAGSALLGAARVPARHLHRAAVRYTAAPGASPVQHLGACTERADAHACSTLRYCLVLFVHPPAEKE